MGRFSRFWKMPNGHRRSVEGSEEDTHEVMAKTNPGQFIREVRQEVSKVTWPTRKETTVTTGMVFLMVFLAATFFFLVDQILGFAIGRILGLGG